MNNEFSFALDSVLSHSGAHYSKNWNKADQTAYNAKYYQEHKDKWKVKETKNSVTYDKQIGDYGEDEEERLRKEHGEYDDHFLGKEGDVNYTKTEDGTSVLLNGNKVLASGKDAEGLDTAVLTKYLNDIYKQADEHLEKNDIKKGSAAEKFFFEEFNKKVNEQLKGLITKQKQAEHSGLLEIPIDALDDDNYLEHHGILGMHWGKRNGPPYPLDASNYSSDQKAAAKKAGIKVGGSSGKGSIGNLNSSSNPNRVKTKSKEELETPEEHEAKRKAALASGDKKQIKKYATESSYQELNEAINKADLMKKLDEVPQQKSNFDKVDDFFNQMNKVVNWSTTAINAYNNVAKVRNALPGNEDNQWKIVGGDKKKKKEASHSFSGRNEFYSNLDIEPVYLLHCGILEGDYTGINQFSFNLDTGNYLEHHGILGMHWGKRNGPPYPLDRKHSDRGPTPGSKTIEDKTALKINIGFEAARTGFIAASLPTVMPIAPIMGIAAIICTTAMTGYSIGKYVKRDKKAKQADEKVKQFAEERSKSPIDKITGLHKKTKQMSMEEDMERVNPGFENWDENTKNNCAYCTMSYELRRRGYDVAAKTSLEGMTFSDITNYFPKAKIKTDIEGNADPLTKQDVLRKNANFTTKEQKSMINNLVGELSKEKNGRGYISIRWAGMLNGHSVAYEVHDGEVTFLDTQANKKYNGEDINDIGSIGSIGYVRLDNVDIDKKKIKEICD